MKIIKFQNNQNKKGLANQFKEPKKSNKIDPLTL